LEDSKEQGLDRQDHGLRSYAKALGPGIITGASDDDPSGIATYSQVGAKFGFGLLWMAVFQYPLMSAIQEMCARIGMVTGNGLAAVIASKYSKKVILPVSTLLLLANTINIGADISAMAASTLLLLPQVPFIAASVAFAGLIAVAVIAVPYRTYARVLKYLAMALFAYVITAAITGGSWTDIAIASVVPHVEFTAEFALLFVAVFGTTISPYLFFWQTSSEAEENADKGKTSEINSQEKPRVSKKEVKMMRADVMAGMGFSQLIMWSIIVTTAGSLHETGTTEISTVEEAAAALEPVAGAFPYAGAVAKAIFALGVIGTGLLSIPVLAGASAYAISDVFGWKEGLGKKFSKAKPFYTVIAASVVAGLSMNLTGIDPIQALVYSAVINAVISIPILFLLLRVANDKKILGRRTNGRLSNALGWLTLFIMAGSVCIMAATQLL
jgi:NRAMP (natural resistance-associated macrophage protein)-like metal ion transporter